jgi:aspartyl aminopeptidase
VVADLLAFVDAAPSPFHAVAEATRRLDDAGFTAVARDQPWPAGLTAGYVAEGGALVAWSVPHDAPADAPFRLVGAHTDSPNLRIKPRPDIGTAGWRQLAVEVYGGALVNSWLDRDLGLSGRVVVRSAGGPEARLFKVDRPILRVPQLAIHLDRDVWDKGLQLNRQTHLNPVWSLGGPDPGRFERFLAGELEVAPDEVMAWDVMAHDVTPATLAGVDDELISAPRLDNLCSCAAAVAALVAAHASPGAAVAVISLFDHEEVGSISAAGAGGALLEAVVEQSVLSRGGDRSAHLRALAGSACASADMAHATHPNYPERHEPAHPVRVNGGPVIKINTNQRYATDARTDAWFADACDAAGVPFQRFVSRSDMPCGSTIGPITAARLGIPTVDVGVAQLAMHSIRELCGAADPALFTRALTAWLDGAGAVSQRGM